MALINTNKEWIYLLEPHTASRSTSSALRRFGFVEVGGWHAKLQPLYEQGKIPDPTHYEIGVTVRNPLDVLVTRWLKDRPKGLSLYDWLEKKEPVYWVRPLMGLWESATTVCWYEHLDEDLQYIFDAPDLMVDFDPSHKSREKPNRAKRPWWVYIEEEPRVCQKVLRHYAAFMEKFGYHLSTWRGRPHMYINQDIRKRLRRKIR